MTNLLHMTYELRRRKNVPVTSAVKDVIIQTEKFSQVKIIDLLRVPSFNEELVKAENNNHLLINSFGLPFGIFLITSLKRAFKKVIDAENKGIINIRGTDVIHAHKVSFEGFIAYQLALQHNTKLILTLRQTDAWIFKRRPDLIRHFQTGNSI